MLPARLPVETFDHFYRGGGRIRAFRGGPPRGERTPEEWLGSVTTRLGGAPLGLSRLEDGTLLRDAIAADPQAWLGEEHLARFGTDTGVLVKLLDAGERLPVHLHPTREFARRHLDCAYGKTEAWVVLEAEPDATVHLGFAEPVERAVLDELVRSQDADGLLRRMHELPVHAGDTVLVPAGLPHALGEGILVLEVQEPTDFSILLEWAGFDIDGAAEGHLGMGFDRALDAVAGAVPAGEVKALRRADAFDVGREDRLHRLLPDLADPYFRVEAAAPAEALVLPPGFAVLFVVGGSGELRTGSGPETAAIPLSRGDALAVPHAAWPLVLTGGLRAVLCRPPAEAPAR